MLTSDQINDLHRLYVSERWPIRKIERHLNMGWKTIKKYLETPAQGGATRERAASIEPESSLRKGSCGTSGVSRRAGRAALEKSRAGGACGEVAAADSSFHTTLALSDGSLMLEGRSGDVALDRAAWGALTGSNYPPLPREFHGPYLELRAYFLYNTEPPR